MHVTYRSSSDRFEVEAVSCVEQDELHIGFPDGGGQMLPRRFVRCSAHPANLVLQHADLELSIRFEEPEALRSFVAGHLTTIADLASFCAGAAPGEVVMVAAVAGSSLWITCLYEDARRWSGRTVCRRRVDEDSGGMPSWPELSTFCASPSERNAISLWRLLSDTERGLALPEDFPALVSCLPPLTGAKRRMTVKLDPGTQWLILLPFDLIARTGAGSMASVGEIEWVVTTKTLVRCAEERAQMVRDLSELGTVIAHTVVILNDYDHYDAASRRATLLMADLLSLLERVDIQRGASVETTGLRWIHNPTAIQLREVLRDPNTWYAFAGFHAEAGCWQLGGEAGPFPLDWLDDGDLAHIRMLRTYHCNSIFDPDRPTFSGDSINSRLLRAGARRVEGSTLPESHLTYIAHLRDVLCSSPGIFQVLVAACMEQGRDLGAILDRLEVAVLGTTSQH